MADDGAGLGGLVGGLIGGERSGETEKIRSKEIF